MANRKGAAEQAAQRRPQALALRQQGFSYRAIAAQLGLSQSQAIRDVRSALSALSEQEREEAALLRRLENERLDAMLVALWPDAIAGKLLAVDRVLAISDRRAKLWGLYAPTRVRHSGDAEQPIVHTIEVVGPSDDA
jgi:hypothetical protein